MQQHRRERLMQVTVKAQAANPQYNEMAHSIDVSAMLARIGGFGGHALPWNIAQTNLAGNETVEGSQWPSGNKATLCLYMPQASQRVSFLYLLTQLLERFTYHGSIHREASRGSHVDDMSGSSQWPGGINRCRPSLGACRLYEQPASLSFS